MLGPVKHELRKKTIILASSSPRRSELLTQIGLEFEIYPSNIDEQCITVGLSDPTTICRKLAEKKAISVYEELKGKRSKIDLVIGADTLVVCNNQIFGKPLTPDEADRTLTLLSGKPHSVISAVCLLIVDSVNNKVKTIVFDEETKVYMADLSPKIIQEYVATKEPMDKAGGYAIQGRGANLISKIEGDYYNVVGLPLHKLSKNILQYLTTSEL